MYCYCYSVWLSFVKFGQVWLELDKFGLISLDTFRRLVKLPPNNNIKNKVNCDILASYLGLHLAACMLERVKQVLRLIMLLMLRRVGVGSGRVSRHRRVGSGRVKSVSGRVGRRRRVGSGGLPSSRHVSRRVGTGWSPSSRRVGSGRSPSSVRAVRHFDCFNMLTFCHFQDFDFSKNKSRKSLSSKIPLWAGGSLAGRLF